MNLKDDIWITGYTNESIFNKEVDRYDQFGIEIIYAGETNDISEEVAKRCVNNFGIHKYKSYYIYSDPTQYDKCFYMSAQESIQSACSSKYCIIHKKI